MGHLVSKLYCIGYVILKTRRDVMKLVHVKLLLVELEA